MENSGCPQCHGWPVRIQASVAAVVDSTMSADATGSDIEWSNDSRAWCEQCGWKGSAADIDFRDEEEW